MKLSRPLYILTALALAPVALVVNFLLWAVLSAAAVYGRLQRKGPEKVSGVSEPEASIVIPSWNGRELLAECLPALEKALGSGGSHEIIVVDNGSDDGSEAYLKENFPRVRVVSSKRNLGFGGAANLGIKAAQKDIVVLLNNDMVVDEDFLHPLLNMFSGDPKLFAASARIFFQDRGKTRQETGKTGACLRHGAIYPYHVHEDGQPAPIAYAGGGSSAYDRKKLLELGGFDELYQPFYVEDLDLSFRAWRRGWKVMYNPESVVCHKHRGTIGVRFSQAYIEGIIRRNETLFVWKNILSARELLSHFAWLWLRLVWRTAAGSTQYARAYFGALGRAGMAISRRTEESRRAVVPEREVFARFSDLSAFKRVFAPRKVLRPGIPLRILFVCPYIPYPPSHGGAVRMYNLIKQLAARHEVYLLSFVENEQELDGRAHLEGFCREARLFLRRETPRRDSMLWLRPQSSLNEFYSREFEAALAEMVNKYDIDIVQYEYTQMAQYVRDFPRAKNVLTEHDVNFVTRYRHFRSLSWSGEKLKALLRWTSMLVWELDMCRRFDLICAMSSLDKKLLLTYDRRLPVSDAAPTGADTAYYQPGRRTEAEENTLLFVGFFKHLPNVEGILYFSKEVYPLVQKRVPGVKLYVAGANPPPEVMALGADPSIKVLGFVEDLRDWYARASAFVVPINRGAGTRVKIFEAMAAGIPIISTGLGAEGIAVKDREHIILADTPESFAAAVVSLLQDPGKASRLAAAARELVVEKYEWANIASRLAEEYYSLWQ